MDNQIFTNYKPNFQKPLSKSLPILKVVFIIFALVIVFELLLGAKKLFTPIKVVRKVVPFSSLSEGSINLTANKSSFKVGEKVPVLVKISTGNHLTAGVDLVLKYNPAILEASPSPVISGNTFDDYPALTIDAKAGILRASGLVAPAKSGFNGSGDFGTINFTAKSSGMTEVSLDFSKDATGDSNMMESITNKDILGKTGSVKINIQ